MPIRLDYSAPPPGGARLPSPPRLSRSLRAAARVSLLPRADVWVGIVALGLEVALVLAMLVGIALGLLGPSALTGALAVYAAVLRLGLFERAGRTVDLMRRSFTNE